MKIDLKELSAAVEHIKKSSHDMSISVREDGRILKLVCMSLQGTILEIDLYDEEVSTHAKVRESRDLLIK